MLENFEHITSITISNYIREVEVSKSQNAKYFEWDGTTIRCKSKKLWKKCINLNYIKLIILNNNNIKPQWLKDNYKIVEFKGKYIYRILRSDTETLQQFVLTTSQLKLKSKFILCEKFNDGMSYSFKYEPVIANPTQAGTPNKAIISGQYIYNGNYNPFMQGKILDAIKLNYYNKFKKIPEGALTKLRIALFNNYPILLIAEIQDTVKRFNDKTKKGNGRKWDVGNFAYPYLKTFSDFLSNGFVDKEVTVLEPIIEDDDRLHIMGEMSYFTPIEEGHNRKLIFHIYADTRQLWVKYKQNKTK